MLCCVFSLTSFAALLTATLQSGDKLTPFYGENAFVEAYNAAIDGDVITLSPGVFNTTDIAKGVTVIGAYAFTTDTSKATQLGGTSSNTTVSTNNVTIEGVRIAYRLTMKGCDNLTLNRCYIVRTDDMENGEHKYHNNTIITDCLIDECYSMDLSQNAVFRNCCINIFLDCNDKDKPALIENCNIPVFRDEYYSRSGIQPYAIYRKCFLGLRAYQGTYTLTLSSPSEFHDNVFYSNWYYFYISSLKYKWTINYGSCVHAGNKLSGNSYDVSAQSDSYRNSSMSPYTVDGVSYGPLNHKSYPAVTEITSSTIDTETDADGKLHVKISATARD